MYADWVELNERPVLMGVLNAVVVRGKELFYFEYDSRWINAGFRHVLDSDLQMFSGAQYVHDEKPNFGLFLDSSPDRWGRLLMRRREAALAKFEKRAVKNLKESDYLLGVFDANRMGALRFKLAPNEKFLDDQVGMATPPFARLRSLEYASLQLERSDAPEDKDYMNWLNLLINPGGSLGGARPKAGILGEDGNLWIAKFPSANDDIDKGAWEMVVHDLAANVGISVPEAQLKRYNSKHHTYITKRFDRTKDHRRIHFASAMTMLGYADGTDFHDGASYLEIVEFLVRNGSRTAEDLEELWTRIVFNIAVTNTDDHLRNHGFLLTQTGWCLSPAYDMNPEQSGSGLSLNISEDDNALDYHLANAVSPLFRLSESRANEIMQKVKREVGNWRMYASKYGVPRAEQELVSRAFRVE